MERPWLVFIVHLFTYSTNNYWGLTFSMLSEAGTCSQEQNAVGGGESGLVCPGKASPRRRRVGHAEIWLRTCQAEEAAKMLKRKQAWRVWAPAEARVDAGRVREKQGLGLCGARWIAIRTWDLLWVESYRKSLSLGIAWPAQVLICPSGSLWRIEWMGAKEEPTVITQTRDDGGRDQGDIPRGGEKWPNPILQI